MTMCKDALSRRMIMPRATTRRKQLFRAALALSGMTLAEWAAREDIARETISRVLNGKQGASMVLLAKIDEFTQKQLSKRTALAS
jgi:transcriptional regulator with XRE-family HTH domain